MALTVREMMSSEVNIIIQYFQDSTPEHLGNPRRRPLASATGTKLARALAARMHAPNRAAKP